MHEWESLDLVIEFEYQSYVEYKEKFMIIKSKHHAKNFTGKSSMPEHSEPIINAEVYANEADCRKSVHWPSQMLQ